MKKHILYFAPNDRPSMKILEIIRDNGIMEDFEYVDVIRQRPLPSIIKSVPTILAENVVVPLVGKAAFDWLENTKYFYQRTDNINNVVVNPNIQNDETLKYNPRKEFTGLRDDEVVDEVVVKDVKIKKEVSDRNLAGEVASRNNNLYLAMKQKSDELKKALLKRK